MTVAHFYTVKQNRQKYTKYKTDIKHKACNLQYAVREKHNNGVCDCVCVCECVRTLKEN